MTRREFQMCLIIFLLVVLSGCTTQVEKDYKSAVSAYETGDYEAAIEGFRQIGDYKDSQTLLDDATHKYISQLIQNVGESISDESEIIGLFEMCSGMTSEEFSTVDGAEFFEAKFYDYIDEQNSKVQIEESLERLRQFEFLSDACIEKCMISCGRWGCVNSAEDYVKDRLKSPRSYNRNSGSVSAPNKATDDDYYSVTVTLDYGATNGFGGEVRNKEEILVHFTPNLADMSIEWHCVGDILDILEDALNKIG